MRSQEHDAPTVLVVEDDATLLELLVWVLSEEMHCRVLPASTGPRAITITAQETPQLMLLDYRLAGSMNGLELYDLLHAREGWHDIQAIVVSANVPELQRELQLRHLTGIAKPFDVEELLAMVNGAFSSSMRPCVFAL